MEEHIKRLLACRRCPNMEGRPVHGCVGKSSIVSLGQAPGIHEERFGKPFAYTAGKTLFKWLASIGIEEESFRQAVNMSAVCRCFPGKAKNGDRKPGRQEVDNCIVHLEFELEYHRPELVIPIGKLAIDQILERATLFSGDHSSVPAPHKPGSASKGARFTGAVSKSDDARLAKKGTSQREPDFAREANPTYTRQNFLNSKSRAAYKLEQVIGRQFRSQWNDIVFDWIALPHPSGLNVWNHTEKGKGSIQRALNLLQGHPAIHAAFYSS